MTIPEPLEFLRDGGFRAGVVVAATASGVLAVTVRWRQRSRERARGHGEQPRPGLPSAGLLLVGATLLALRFRVAGVIQSGLPHRLRSPFGLLAGMMLLCTGGVLDDFRAIHAPVPRSLAWIATLSLGAWAIAWHAGIQHVLWIQAATVGATLIGGSAMASFDRKWGEHGCMPFLVALTVIGIYYVVPDTGEALVLLGVALPIAALGWPWATTRLGCGGSFAVTGLLAWIVARGGYGRQSSIVGGLACLGLLAIEPAVRCYRRWAWSPLDLVTSGRAFTPIVAAVHLPLVWVASRVAGLQASTPLLPHRPIARGAVAGALEIVTGEVAASLIVVLGLRRWTSRRARLAVGRSDATK